MAPTSAWSVSGDSDERLRAPSLAERFADYNDRRGTAGSAFSPWTVLFSTPSSASCSPTSGCRRIAAALPARARVSEPVLPLLLAALHEQLERGIVCLLPEDADARDAAEAAGWFLGPERVALLPGRGVRWGSGLEPPPHLVGERARALEVLAAGGLVCASAAAVAEGVPPAVERPGSVRLEVGSEPGVGGLAEELALAGYERVDRAEERGQFAVRGGIVDVFPTTGREPLRVEFFGDEIEGVRVFSPFTQRALHPVDDAVVHPAAERKFEPSDTVSLGSSWADDDEPAVIPTDLVPVLGPGARLRLGARRGASRLVGGGARGDLARGRVRSSIPSRSRSRSPSRRNARRSPRAAWPRPSRSSTGSSAAATAWWSPSRTPVRRCGRRTC